MRFQRLETLLQPSRYSQLLIEAGILKSLPAIFLFYFQEIRKCSNAMCNACASFKASLRPEATVKRDGKWKSIDGSLVVPGDLVLLATGSSVPADCRINEGQIEVDQAALTGESLPVQMFKGDSCKMGSTVVRGEVEGTVEFTGANSFFGRTASLLQVRVSLYSVLFSIVS